jgi:hypothetical protein
MRNPMVMIMHTDQISDAELDGVVGGKATEGYGTIGETVRNDWKPTEVDAGCHAWESSGFASFCPNDRY